MPELNVLCGIADISTQSEQPVTKHLVVEVTPAGYEHRRRAELLTDGVVRALSRFCRRFAWKTVAGASGVAVGGAA